MKTKRFLDKLGMTKTLRSEWQLCEGVAMA